MRISDGSSDVCSSDHPTNRRPKTLALVKQPGHSKMACLRHRLSCGSDSQETDRRRTRPMTMPLGELTQRQEMSDDPSNISSSTQTEEHTSELQSLMRISYAVFCLQKKITATDHTQNTTPQNIDILP